MQKDADKIQITAKNQRLKNVIHCLTGLCYYVVEVRNMTTQTKEKTKEKTKKVKKDAFVALRLSQRDKDDLQKRANEKRLSLSSYILSRIYG